MSGLRHPGWAPEVRAGLAGLLAGPPGVAVFDCDHTLLDGDVSESLLADLAAERGEPLVEAYEAACRADLLRGYVGLVPTLVAGRTEREARGLARATLARNAIRVRPAMRELVEALTEAGWALWVVSASAEVLVREALADLPLRPERVLGMRLPRVPGPGGDPVFGEVVERPYPWREGKVEALLAAGVAPTFAAGDSQGDLPMMHLAGRALLVDRGAGELRARARDAGFWVQPEAALAGEERA